MTAAPRRIGWVGWLIVAFALAIRLYYISVAEVDTPLRADAGQYFRIALNVEKYHTFSRSIPGPEGVTPDSYRAPGYPALIAGLHALTGDIEDTYWAVLILQCLMGAATVAFSLGLAMRVMPYAWACATALLVAVWPHLITLGGYVLTETTFGFLVALAAFSTAWLFEKETRGALISAGLGFAAAALVNQIILALSALIVGWYLVSRRSAGAVLFACLALGPPALWALRDARIHSAPGDSASGRLMENVLVGMEPDYIPQYQVAPSQTAAVAALQRISDGLRAYATDPRAELAEIGSRLAADPAGYLIWYASKPARFWTWSIEQGWGDVYVYPMLFTPFDRQPLLRLVAAICHGLNGALMWAAFAGVIAFGIRRRKEPPEFACAGGIVVLLFLVATLAHTLLNPDARYAVPFRPFEIIAAVMAVSLVIDWARRRRDSAGSGTTRAAGGPTGTVASGPP